MVLKEVVRRLMESPETLDEVDPLRMIGVKAVLHDIMTSHQENWRKSGIDDYLTPHYREAFTSDELEAANAIFLKAQDAFVKVLYKYAKPARSTGRWL